MKKISLFIIALFYLSITSGVEVNWHYCMGKLASVAWGKDHNDRCARCGMQDKQGCCETVSHFVKVSDEHQSSTFHWASTLEFQAEPVIFKVQDAAYFAFRSTSTFFEKPPPIEGRSRRSQIQVYRI